MVFPYRVRSVLHSKIYPILFVSEEGKKKFIEELEDIHVAFKDHICLNRPQMKATIEEIATGEAYLAVQAKKKGLVDEIRTSDEYFESIAKDYDIVSIQEKKKKPFLPFDVADLSALQQKVTTTITKPMFV